MLSLQIAQKYRLSKCFDSLILAHFPCFFPYQESTRETFYLPPATLSSILADVRFASRVECA